MAVEMADHCGSQLRWGLFLMWVAYPAMLVVQQLLRALEEATEEANVRSVEVVEDKLVKLQSRSESKRISSSMSEKRLQKEMARER